MAKEKPEDPERAARKAEKKAKKEKRSEKDGVHKSKKAEASETTAAASILAEAQSESLATSNMLDTIEAENPGSVVIKTDDGEVEVTVKASALAGAMVPFANPLADNKLAKKVFRGTKKANKHAALKRGVKEVVKALRKSPMPGPTSSAAPFGLVVLAADISPPDVISHIPVLCEDHGIPYVYVASRAELGAAGSTKRPTSVVLITSQTGKRKEGDAGAVEDKDDEDWDSIYSDLLKAVQKASRTVTI